MLYLGRDFNTHIGITTTVRNVIEGQGKSFWHAWVTAKVSGMVRVPEKDVIKLQSRHVAVKRTLIPPITPHGKNLIPLQARNFCCDPQV